MDYPPSASSSESEEDSKDESDERTEEGNSTGADTQPCIRQLVVHYLEIIQ